jgi:2-polyprenyl-3-methyl-5-hydroxy-6-metoxy-1,4-benzoquinol methylase
MSLVNTCRICGNFGHNSVYTVREMMFGTREKFDYFECSKCGCLQIVEIPSDISKYYPDNYYSYNYSFDFKAKIKIRLKTLALKSRHYKGKFFKQITAMLADFPSEYQFLSFAIEEKYLSMDKRVLDVGCGSGALLMQMSDMGFTSLQGIDPFLEDDISHGDEILIQKKYINEVKQLYDFIMLNHSFEHMLDPVSILSDIANIISSEGFLLIRIPVASSFAWKKYGVNWVQLDAPRHIHLHTCESMKFLAEKSGFEIVGIEFDSQAFQFWASEQYQMDIPLFSKNSYAVNKKSNVFKRKQIKDFSMRSKKLNLNQEGDQACFFLKKVASS